MLVMDEALRQFSGRPAGFVFRSSGSAARKNLILMAELLLKDLWLAGPAHRLRHREY